MYMNTDAIRHCLSLLGERLERDIEITLAGGAALHLAHGFTRGTQDIDALLSRPPFDEDLRRWLRAIGEEEEVGAEWLNNAAKAFVDVLDPGFLDRRIHISRFERLDVHALDRKSLILMKLYAMRDPDLEDLERLQPTQGEMEFVAGELDRIGRSRPDKAHRIQLYLEQGGRR